VRLPILNTAWLAPGAYSGELGVPVKYYQTRIGRRETDLAQRDVWIAVYDCSIILLSLTERLFRAVGPLNCMEGIDK